MYTFLFIALPASVVLYVKWDVRRQRRHNRLPRIY